MVRVPAGVFVMGAVGRLGGGEEQPAHEAIVPAFDFDLTEVTNEAYAACEAAGACPPRQAGRQLCDDAKPERLQFPVNCVDLRQAKAYCEWAGKRLPTEREWEYAARGGSEQRSFSWGNEEPTSKRSCYEHAGGSCKVASFEPGAFGLFDVSGNLWEWTQSEFGPYPSHAEADPVVDGKYYVYRGGSWSRRFPKWLRNDLRNRYRPHEWSAALGMRCARSVEPLECPKDTEARDGRCVRVSGTSLCNPGGNATPMGRTCVPADESSGHTPLPERAAPVGMAAKPGVHRAGTPTAGGSPTAAPAVSAASTGERPITRSRTPAFDPDCQRHWPRTPAAYRFEGGKNFPARAPIVSAAGCVTRDMGQAWTSACCPG